MELSTHRRAPNVRVALEHGNLQPRLGEVSRVGQPVMARPDDYRVVFIHPVIRPCDLLHTLG